MSITDKIDQIEELIKNNFLPSPKGPKKVKAPDMGVQQPTQPPQVQEAPKSGANLSQKDPAKVAEQMQNPDLKDNAKKQAEKMKEGITVNKLGQWNLSTKR